MNQVTGFFRTERPLQKHESILPDGEHDVPLVTYANGEDKIIGTAHVTISGNVLSATMTLSEEVAQELGLYVALEDVTYNNLPNHDKSARVVVQNRMSIKKED